MQDKYAKNEVFEDKVFLEETIRGYEFVDCDFNRCSLDNTTVEKCIFTDCIFTDCTITNSFLPQTRVRNIELYGCNIVNINWNEIQSSGRLSSPINKMENTRFKYNNFTEMLLNRYDFTSCDLNSCLFADCELVESNFSGCSLNSTEFYRTDLRKSDFRQASGYQVDITNCNLKGAKFSHPDAYSLLDSLEIILD